MKIKLIYPEIRTSQPSYQTTSGTLTVMLGFISANTNVVDEFVSPIVRLIDTRTGDIVSSETVQVRLNAFTTEYTLTGLQPEALYALVIDNYNNRLTTSIISTLTDTSSIQVVGREKIFNPSSLFFGQDIERPVYEPGPVDFRKGLDLINNTQGTAVIVEAGQTYTFCPTHVITTRSDYPNTIDYRPLPGLSLRSIVINKLPRIIKLSNKLYGIVPPTVMRIANFAANVNLITGGPVSEIDLNNYNLSACQNHTPTRLRIGSVKSH